MTEKKSVCVLGATGSVGSRTVDVLKAHADKYNVDAVTAHCNVASLAETARSLNAKMAVIANPDRNGMPSSANLFATTDAVFTSRNPGSGFRNINFDRFMISSERESIS